MYHSKIDITNTGLHRGLAPIPIICTVCTACFKWYVQLQVISIEMVIHLMLLGEVYKEFNIGPKTEPWGTPWVRYNEFDEVSFTFVYCARSDKNETNQSNTLPRIPKRVESLRVKIVWSTVSNAADKSRRTRMTEWALSIAVTISLSTFFLRSLCYGISCTQTVRVHKEYFKTIQPSRKAAWMY